MEPVSFAQLPFIAKFATMGTYFLGWVCFAEFVIDRHGLDRFLPFYRVGNICPYEGLVVALLALLWWQLHRAG